MDNYEYGILGPQFVDTTTGELLVDFTGTLRVNTTNEDFSARLWVVVDDVREAVSCAYFERNLVGHIIGGDSYEFHCRQVVSVMPGTRQVDFDLEFVVGSTMSWETRAAQLLTIQELPAP